jgi:hypothetical protein
VLAAGAELLSTGIGVPSIRRRDRLAAGSAWWIKSGESRVEIIDISSVRGLTPQPVAPVFVFVQRSFWTQ